MTNEAPVPTVQEIQTELARTRTLLALDRTLLAWIRTSLSLIAFGFALAKYVHDMIASGSLHVAGQHYPRQLGLTLMTIGIAGLLGGVFDHWRSVRRLNTKVPISPWCASIVVALLLATIGIILIADLVFGLTP